MAISENGQLTATEQKPLAANEKEQLILTMNQSVGVMHQIDATLNTINQKQTECSELEAKATGHKGIKIFGYIVSVYMFFGGMPMMLNSLAGGIFMIAVGTLLFYGVRSSSSKPKKKMKALEAEITALGAEVETLCNNPLLTWLPANYRIFGMEIKNYIDCGRADSLKEALNLLEDDMHKRRLESNTAAAMLYSAAAASDAKASKTASAIGTAVNIFSWLSKG